MYKKKKEHIKERILERGEERIREEKKKKKKANRRGQLTRIFLKEKKISVFRRKKKIV